MLSIAYSYENPFANLLLNILINSSIRGISTTPAISEVIFLSICQSLLSFLVLISFSVCVVGFWTMAGLESREEGIAWGMIYMSLQLYL